MRRWLGRGKRERFAAELTAMHGDVAAQVAFVRASCCVEIVKVVDLAVAAGRLEGVYPYPLAIAFWLKRDSAAWLEPFSHELSWNRNAKTAHEQWLRYASCDRHAKAGIGIVVDT